MVTESYTRELQQIPDIRQVLRLALRHLKVFLFFSGLTALIIAWRAIPDKAALTPARVYLSSASIVFPDNNPGAMERVLGVPARQEVHFWLSSPEIFDNFLLENKIREKIGQKLNSESAKKFAEAWTYELHFRLHFVGQEEDSNSATIDYAKPEESRKLEQQQVPSRLVIHGTGDSPETAMEVANAAQQVIQKALIETACRTPRKQQSIIRNYLKLNSKRNKQLMKSLEGQDPNDQERRNHKIAQLEAEEFRLRNEIDSLAAAANSELSDSNSALIAHIAQSLQTEEHNLILLRQVYQPDAEIFQEAEKRVQFQRRTYEKFTEAAKEGSRQISRFQIRAKQQLLEQCTQQLHDLKRQQLNSKENLKAWEISKNLDAVENETLLWEQRLLQARLSEQLAKTDGTSVLLREAEPGEPNWIIKKSLSAESLSNLKKLPFALLVGIIASILCFVWEDINNVEKRMQYYCDIPMIAAVPKIPPDMQCLHLEGKK